MREFFIGAPDPTWFEKVGVPICVSRSRIAGRRKRKPLVPGTVPAWMLDSGAFTELERHGRWTVDHRQYGEEAGRWAEQTGTLRLAAVQDWMCEPYILAKTGLTVLEHQRRTLESYLLLKRDFPALPWMPVLQGFTRREYERHLAMYDAAGIELRALPRVGLGSVCRRHRTVDVDWILAHLREQGVRVHGFGLKVTAVRRCWDLLHSSDSAAWSRNGRFDARQGKAAHGAANSPAHALQWRERMLVQANAEPSAFRAMVGPLFPKVDRGPARDPHVVTEVAMPLAVAHARGVVEFLRDI